ncbi:hypothetical protein [Tautonia marina]|uniref:hypothetical protein n=1 Tax=Tautonia marina TaxID=2653855 RepID=UPI0012611CEF|nr:hypothetical protein [Tautonia marina]
MSRLWDDPPLKPDGSLDYARLTLGEICEDVTESLMDRVFNGGDAGLVPFLDALPEADAIPAGAPVPEGLVGLMEELLRREGEDPAFGSPGTREVLGRVVRALQEEARSPA